MEHVNLKPVPNKLVRLFQDFNNAKAKPAVDAFQVTGPWVQ